MEKQAVSLYEKLGGQAAVVAVVEEFYKRILADDRINFIFDQTDMDRLKRHQAAFISFAVGGPNHYTGRSMQKAHKGLKITPEQFQIVAMHLSDSLANFDVDQESIDQVIEKVASLKDDVIGQ